MESQIFVWTTNGYNLDFILLLHSTAVLLRRLRILDYWTCSPEGKPREPASRTWLPRDFQVAC
ncbi:unnamed protein product [Ectocarpus sp. CCAP 1310/34]|nr:unnamed protein product [Ectocarpus sp. CCAP 1310/34]